MITPMHAAAAFLNPAFSDSFKETCEMKQGINNIFDNLVVADEKQAFLEQVQLYRMAYARLFTSSARAMLRTSHPRECLLFAFSLSYSVSFNICVAFLISVNFFFFFPRHMVGLLW